MQILAAMIKEWLIQWEVVEQEDNSAKLIIPRQLNTMLGGICNHKLLLIVKVQLIKMIMVPTITVAVILIIVLQMKMKAMR